MDFYEDLKNDFEIEFANRMGYGANLTDIFLILKNQEFSKKLILKYKGKKYENREIKIICIPQFSYKKYYQKILNK